MRTAIVVDFQRRSALLQRQEAEREIEQLDGFLTEIRQNLSFVSIIQELSRTYHNGLLDLQSQHIDALSDIQAALERIVSLMGIQASS